MQVQHIKGSSHNNKSIRLSPDTNRTHSDADATQLTGRWVQNMADGLSVEETEVKIILLPLASGADI